VTAAPGTESAMCIVTSPEAPRVEAGMDQAMATAEKLSDPQQRGEAIVPEQKRNLGHGLYKALREHGGWRVNPNGWRAYRGVMQLFGPWTATEGPWKAMQIKDPNPYQQQRLADQQWVFRAHQDHIHVAK
jgi:hypothetical protein